MSGFTRTGSCAQIGVSGFSRTASRVQIGVSGFSRTGSCAREVEHFVSFLRPPEGGHYGRRIATAGNPLYLTPEEPDKLRG